jgi:hypothetical protein
MSGVLIVLMGLLPACQAQTATTLDKHARKIHKKLAHYPAGAYLHLTLRDHSDQYGSLGSLSDASFRFTNSDANKTETHLYSEVAGVKKGKEYIGEGAGSEHHVRHLVPILIVAAAAGTAAAIVVSKEE